MTSVASAGSTAWQTPEYTVVETSLEVTAYRLADR
ncbi:pyrroloquinoline quinone precursor peptide PqqA [Streptomyces lasiicapitis]